MISSHSRSDLFVEYVNKSLHKFGRSLVFWIFFQKIYLLYIGTEGV
jgi:hypothetical protein